jgi:acetylornithine deacetylase/succinyl-diaminopimelate desuccinylase-like protein
MMEDIRAYLAAERPRTLAELCEFVSIPSVSADPAHASDIDRAASWVADRLREAGPFQVKTLATSGHPVVYGEWLDAGRAPTVLVYGHYDVQPPDPLDRWLSDPFRPEERDGRLYARGVSDDKGPMLIPIKVAQAFFATRGALPVNVKFLFEGEEEISSPSLEGFILEHKELLAADFVISADGAMWRVDVPSLTIASRGLAGLEFTLRGPAKDLHSGRHGGGLANPLHAIAELLAGLHTADGRVAVDGFYDDVRDLSAAERAAIAALPFDDQAYLRAVGAPALQGEVGYSTLERQWARPTLEINGLWGGYQGVGSKTVLPSEAHAKITCRLVPDQHPEEILRRIQAHVRTHLPPGVSLEFLGDTHPALPYRIAPEHPGLQTALAVLRQTYGREPYLVRMGGTVPVSEVFRRVLGMDTVFFSFSTADEDFHAPNEFFRINRLWEGLGAWALYWELLGRQGS